MKHGTRDLLLLLVLCLGGLLAWRADRERGRLQREHLRLAGMTGDLPIADPSKVYVRALETGDRLHFAWRVYLPPNYSQILKTKSGDLQSSSWSSGPSQFIARVRIREDKQGVLQIYTRFAGGSSTMRLGDQALGELLRGRREDIAVEQSGARGIVAIAPDQQAVLLRLTLPEDIQAAARKTLSPWTLEHFVPVLFELKLDPKATRP